MTISLQTGSGALAAVNGSDPSQAIGSTSSSEAGATPFQVVLNQQQQQATLAAAAAKPAASVAGGGVQAQYTAQSSHVGAGAVMVNGTRCITQCYTYDFLANNVTDDVYEISGAQMLGMAVRIYDPSGQKSDVDFQPGDDVVAVMKANNIPIHAADQGVSYEYAKLFTTTDWTPDVSSGKKSPIQLEAQVVQQMLGDGWSSEALAPWINQVASYLPTPASGASPAPTGSLPLATADSVAAGVSTDPGSSTSAISALADTPVAAAQVTSTPEAAVAPVAVAQDTSTPAEVAVAPVAVAQDTSTPAEVAVAPVAVAQVTSTPEAAVAPSSTDPVRADAVNVAPATNSAPLASLYQDLQSAAVKASPDNATAAGSSGVEWTPADWAQQVRQLTSNPDVLPSLDQMFPKVDFQQPMTLLDFWAGAQDSIRL